MNERPILFSAPMVRAILEGRKTQTRRIVKLAKVYEPDFGKAVPDKAWIDDSYMEPMYGGVPCLKVPFDGNGNADMVIQHRHFPSWEPGDTLFVRENGWERPERTPRMLREGADTWARYYYDADLSPAEHERFKAWGFKRRPSIHMPRWASRITLKVLEVRVERLHAISAKDIIAEGAVLRGHEVEGLGKCPVSAFDGACYPDLRSVWAAGWAKINGPESWKSNPWVWVIGFAKISNH